MSRRSDEGCCGGSPDTTAARVAQVWQYQRQGSAPHAPCRTPAIAANRHRMTATKPIRAPHDPAEELPFWKRKAMKDMTRAEWESLCDGCGRCCLNKLQEEGTDRTYYTDVGCKLLDGQSCRCTDYVNRSAKVKDCVTLTTRNINRISWLPPTCGYKLVAAGKDLYWWHPLVSGDPETVHQAGVSVRGKVGASEVDVPDKDLEDHIVSWPLKWPRGAKGKSS